VAAILVVSIQNSVRAHGGSMEGAWAALIPFGFGYLVLSSGSRRLHAACLRGCWLRAGPDGIAFRLPYGGNWQTLFLTYRMCERTFGWSEVKRLNEVRYTVNGMPFGQALSLRTTGERFYLGGYFAETPALILMCIDSARKEPATA
jgi:hypothetical protein